MEPDQGFASAGVNDLPDLSPVEIPGQSQNPTVEDRLSEIEKVLSIN